MKAKVDAITDTALDTEPGECEIGAPLTVWLGHPGTTVRLLLSGDDFLKILRQQPQLLVGLLNAGEELQEVEISAKVTADAPRPTDAKVAALLEELDLADQELAESDYDKNCPAFKRKQEAVDALVVYAATMRDPANKYC